jgi:predicted dehydrogenase
MRNQYELQKRIFDGKIGRVRHVHAQFCIDSGIESSLDASDRLVDPKLAGGSLLDMGPYPFLWICLTVLHPYLKAHPTDAEELPLPKIVSTMVKSNEHVKQRVGGEIDESTFAMLSFPSIKDGSGEPGEGSDVVAVLQSSFSYPTHSRRSVFVQGTKGNIELTCARCLSFAETDNSTQLPAFPGPRVHDGDLGQLRRLPHHLGEARCQRQARDLQAGLSRRRARLHLGAGLGRAPHPGWQDRERALP